MEINGLKNLKRIEVTNQKLWISLLYGADRISGEEIREISKKYISEREASVLELVSGIIKVEPNSVIEHSVFNYYSEDLDQGNLYNQMEDDIHSAILDSEKLMWSYETTEGGELTDYYSINPAEKAYAAAFINLFKNNILPYMENDEVILATKHDWENAICAGRSKNFKKEDKAYA